jgi:hypothetical protein
MFLNQLQPTILWRLKVTFPTPLLGEKKYLPKYHIAEVFDVVRSTMGLI